MGITIQARSRAIRHRLDQASIQPCLLLQLMLPTSREKHIPAGMAPNERLQVSRSLTPARSLSKITFNTRAAVTISVSRMFD